MHQHYSFPRFAHKIRFSLHDGISVMDDRSGIELMNRTSVTRRVAFGLILLALVLPSLFAWGDGVPLQGAFGFTGQLAAVTLLALIARIWVARHYSPGVQVQALLAFAVVLVGWSGYVSRITHEERVAAAAVPVSSTSARIPGPEAPAR
jgi:hypothetical protein